MKTVSRVDRLTPKQEAQMASYAAHWIDIGLKTGEADWKTFDKYMPIAYKKAGLKYPKNIVHVQSPLIGGLAAAIAEGIWRNRRDAVHDAVGGAVRDAVGDAVDGAVGDAVGGAVDGAISLNADAITEAGIKFAIEIKNKLKINLEWHWWLGGQFWVGYWWRGTAFVNFFFDICGLRLGEDIMERAKANRKISESVNYIWPNRDFVIVCNRPQEIHRNPEGRLHNTRGLAIEYADGWGLYYIHGVKFTEKQFKASQSASITDIIAWEDIDQRSALLRERPVKELLENVPKKLIDHSSECGGYDLWEIELKDIGKAKVLSYTGWSSEKEYIKFAKPNSTDALQSIAEMRGITVEELKVAIKS